MAPAPSFASKPDEVRFIPQDIFRPKMPLNPSWRVFQPQIGSPLCRMRARFSPRYFPSLPIASVSSGTA